MINYKVIYCLLHGGGRASKRQTNSFSPDLILFCLYLLPGFPLPRARPRSAERSNTFSEANPAGGGVSGAKRLIVGDWHLTVGALAVDCRLVI